MPGPEVQSPRLGEKILVLSSELPPVTKGRPVVSMERPGQNLGECLLVLSMFLVRFYYLAD